jgi:hypothetical protein
VPILKNPKHELFAQGLSNRAAFAQAGYKPSDSTASHLANSDKVRTQVDELVSASATKAGVTIDRIGPKSPSATIRRALDWGIMPPTAWEGPRRRGAQAGLHAVRDVAGPWRDAAGHPRPY